jgi:hypothetical protein
MRKVVFYKKACLFIALTLSLSWQAWAQNRSLIQNAALDTTIKVSDHSPFFILKPTRVDTVIWVLYSQKIDTIKAQTATVTGVTSGRVYVFANRQWSYNTFNACGTIGSPCLVSDLIVVDGLICSTSPKYPFDRSDPNLTFVAWTPPALVVIKNLSDTSIQIFGKGDVGAFTKSGGLYYTQTITLNGVTYDSLSTGLLNAPIVPNATYSWYLNGVLIPDANTSSYLPKEKGTYTVIIYWVISNTRMANERIEESHLDSAIFTYQVRQIAMPTGIYDQYLDAAEGQLYPNPASEQVQLQMKGSFDYIIETVDAVQVLSGKGYDHTQVNLQGLKSGIYHVHIQSDGSQKVKRLMVK